MKVLHIIKTKSLKSDGRLLKWIKSLENHKIKNEIFILDDNNIAGKSKFGSTPVHKIGLFWRKIFSKRNGYLFKIPEYTLKTLKFLRKSDSDIWIFHDVQHYLTLYIICRFQVLRGTRLIIWDLHELPHSIFLKPSFKRLLETILERVDLLVYTNEERRNYIIQKYSFQEPRFVVLNNYPDQEYLIHGKSTLPTELDNWLRKDEVPYVLWMGSAQKMRNFDVFLDAYKGFKEKLKLVIMGSVAQEFKEEIDSLEEEGKAYVKFVEQQEIIRYVDHACFSVVLYNWDAINNLYCEPNRLYQLIGRGVPCIVGSNPTMVEIVKELRAGIILSDDGRNREELSNAFSNMLRCEEEFRLNISISLKSEKISWPIQFRNIIDVLENYKKQNISSVN